MASKWICQMNVEYESLVVNILLKNLQILKNKTKKPSLEKILKLRLDTDAFYL